MKTDEVPAQTFERIYGRPWPGGDSPDIIGLLTFFGIKATPGSEEANLELQAALLATPEAKALEHRDEIDKFIAPLSCPTHGLVPNLAMFGNKCPACVLKTNVDQWKDESNKWYERWEHQLLIVADLTKRVRELEAQTATAPTKVETAGTVLGYVDPATGANIEFCGKTHAQARHVSCSLAKGHGGMHSANGGMMMWDEAR